MYQDRFVHRQMELVDGGNIVAGVRVAVVQSQRIRLRIDEVYRRAPEDAVRPGIVDIPGELLTHHAHKFSLVLVGELVLHQTPDGERESDQQNRLDDDDGYLKRVGYMSPRPPVTGPWLLGGPKPKDYINKVDPPAHQQDRHQPVHVGHQLVHLGAVDRSRGLHTQLL